MGIAAGMKNRENQVPEIKVAYPTAAFDANHKNVRVPIHSHRNLFDEKHPQEIRFDNVRRISNINLIKPENAERNGHPEAKAPPRDVKPRNITARLRRAPMMWPILT